MRIVIRKMESDHRDFVIGTWLTSTRRSPSSGLIPMAQWRDVMSPILGGILAWPGVGVRLIVDVDAPPDVALIGHIVWRDADAHDPPLVFFCYVKHDYRGNGFARRLLEAAGIDERKAFDYVCQTRASVSMQEKRKLPRARWRPLRGRYPTGRKDDDERNAQD